MASPIQLSFERGEVPPISCVFTSNGRTVNGKMQPPAELLPRFLSRCLVLNFETVERKPLAAYLEQVWDKEHGPRPYPVEYFEHLADGMGVRDALNRLDSELLAPRPLGEISRILTDRKAAEIEQEAKKVNGFELLVDDAAAVRYGRQLRAQHLAASQA